MQVQRAYNQLEWDSFLCSQTWSPFLQSYAMGEVYRSLGEEPIRLEVRDGDQIVGVCQAIVVDARRGKHLAIMYGPIIAGSDQRAAISALVDELKKIGKEKGCAFIRVSPFWSGDQLGNLGFRPAPLHMLAEHIWYLELKGKSEADVLAGMRKTTRNLIRRSEREGVTVTASDDPMRDLPIFFELYEETRKRHHFVPYSEDFIRAQVEQFSQCHAEEAGGILRDESSLRSDSPQDDTPRACPEQGRRISKQDTAVKLYIARYNNESVAASVHMIYGGETSYHHGASTLKYPKCYASYLLQWTAIKDALERGDHIYNFWGISPEGAKKHPFAGVRTFKTGFGGQLLELQHCSDLPLFAAYQKTWWIETFRKWKRGF